jgi:hypothetical protein
VTRPASQGARLRAAAPLSPRVWLAALLAAFAPLSAAALPQADEDRAGKLVTDAIAALGGDRYLAVEAVATRGVFTPFAHGRPGAPIEFSDTTVFPDKGRTEFGKKKNRVVQANDGDRGWKYDGPRGSLAEQSPDEIRAFQTYVRGNLDNVLRTGWRAEGVRLRYLGRSEFAPRQWVEGVAVEYPEGFRVEIFFNPATKEPAATRYREGEGGPLVESRYHMFIDFNGVKIPRFVDLYRDGVQTARVVTESVDLNPPVAPGFFDQPPSAAGFK